MTERISDISVIICAYTEDRWNELVAAVGSVRRQALSPREIIVVIDRNPDLLVRVRKHLLDVIAIENREAKGASGARNSGVAVAQGEILAFLDDDAIAGPKWIESLAACYTDPHVVGVGGKIEPLWLGARPSWFPDEFGWVVGCTYRGMPTTNAPVRNVIGANMSVRKYVLTAVGGFRESFGNNKGANEGSTSSKWLRHQAGDEETEFCIRVAQQLPGSVWFYTVSAVVQHQVPALRARWYYFLWRCYDEGLGKAGLVKLHDTRTGLSSERTYTIKVLPRGVARGLMDALLQRDLTGLSRAGAIVVGLMMTTVGYLVGNISSRIADLKSIGLATEGHRHSAKIPPPIEVQ